MLVTCLINASTITNAYAAACATYTVHVTVIVDVAVASITRHITAHVVTANIARRSAEGDSQKPAF